MSVYRTLGLPFCLSRKRQDGPLFRETSPWKINSFTSSGGNPRSALREDERGFDTFLGHISGVFEMFCPLTAPF